MDWGYWLVWGDGRNGGYWVNRVYGVDWGHRNNGVHWRNGVHGMDWV